MAEYHDPVLLRDSVDMLDIRPAGVYVAVSLVGDGHSRELRPHTLR